MANTKRPLSPRRKMYLVGILCFGLLLITSLVAYLFVRGLSQTDEETASVQKQEALAQETGYDMTQNTIDAEQYGNTILELTSDAGQSYVSDTLFLGDSNTARMYRLYDYCSYSNAIGSVGMSGVSLSSYACVEFNNSGTYVTMPQAVTKMQPLRVIITFGTNDLAGGNTVSSFIEGYRKGIEAVVAAYPSVDVIINAIPPVGQTHSGTTLTQSGIDEANKAIVEMCEEEGWKFLNSAEVLKDSATGYAKDGYVESSDGIHLTDAAMQELFVYIRTHSYITEDDRPALTSVPTHTGDKDVVTYVENKVVNSEDDTDEETTDEDTDAEGNAIDAAATESPVPTAAAASEATPTPTPTATAASVNVEATPTPTPTATPAAEQSTPIPTPAAAEPTQAPAEETSDTSNSSSGDASGQTTEPTTETAAA